MSKITRNWPRMAIRPRIAFMRQAVDKQKATPSPIPHVYPDLNALDLLVAAAETVDTQIVALEAQLKSLRAERITKTDAAEAEFENDAKHVEADSKGEASLEIACGFAVAGAPVAVGPMAKPGNFEVTASENEGGMDWQCEPVAGFSTMELQSTATPDNDASWADHEPVTHSSGTLAGLPSGTRLYFRTRARGPLGPGPWSDIAWRRVP